MKIREMMTRNVFTVSPDDRIVEAAGLMRVHDVGVLPVVDDNKKVVGMVTDRDIVLRGVADGVDAHTMKVSEAMSVGSITISEDQSVDEAAALMQKYQIRRLPVLNGAGTVVGIISLGDVAVDAHAGLSGKILKDVSEPATPLV
jgi:CBS domain-containing protein